MIKVIIPPELGSRNKAKKKYHLLKDPVFFLSRSDEKWIQELRKNLHLRFHVLPMYLKKLRFKKLITDQDVIGYTAMLASSDEEGWNVVITILKQFKIEKKKK